MTPPTQAEARTPAISIHLILIGLLLAASIAPAFMTWLLFLIHRPGRENVVQVITALMLAAALWKKRVAFGSWASIRPSGAGLLLLLVNSMACFICGGLLHIYTLSWFFTLTLIAAVFRAVYGRQAMERALGMLCFSFFLIPDMPVDLSAGISVPLQLLSTRITALLAGVLIPISAEGNIFYIHGHSFEVTVACSGLNTWIGFLFAGFLWLLFEEFRYRRLLFIVISAPVLALLTNSLRLFITALTAYYASADAAIAIHTNLEYLLFPLGLTLMAYVGKKCHV